MDCEVFFLFKQLYEGLFEAGVDIPVKLAQIVAARIIAIVGELNRGAALDRAALAFHHARTNLMGYQGKLLQLAERGFVKQALSRHSVSCGEWDHSSRRLRRFCAFS